MKSIKSILLILTLFIASCDNISCDCHLYETSTKYKADKVFADKHELNIPFDFHFSVEHKARKVTDATTLKNNNVKTGAFKFTFYDDDQKKNILEEVIVHFLTMNDKVKTKSINNKLVNLREYCEEPSIRESPYAKNNSCQPLEPKIVIAKNNKVLMCPLTCQDGNTPFFWVFYFIPHYNTQNIVVFEAQYNKTLSDVKELKDLPDKGFYGGIRYMLKTFSF